MNSIPNVNANLNNAGITAALRALDDEFKKNVDDTAEEAQSIWHKASKEIPENICAAQFKILGIQQYELRYGEDIYGQPSIIAALVNVDGKIKNLCYIPLNGKISTSLFLTGGEKEGLFYLVNDRKINDHDIVYITPDLIVGHATYESNNGKYSVLVVFIENNIESVKLVLNAKYPNLKILTALIDVDSRRSIDSGNLNEDYRLTAAKLLQKNDHCKDFSLAFLPSPLRKYIEVICQTTDAHPVMITASVLGMVSGYLGKRVFVPKGEYFQTLYPNLWFACVTESGNFKTTALNNGSAIAYKNKSRVIKAIKEIRVRMKGSDAETIDAAVLEMSTQDIILPNKMTGESFIQHLAQGHSGVILVGELGPWLKNLDKNLNSDFMGIMTELYDVPEYWRHTTKTQGDYQLERPIFSIVGVTTMAWLKEKFSIKDLEGGFFPRILFFELPNSDLIPSGLPKPMYDQVKYAEQEFEMVIQNILAEVGDEKRMTLSDAAKKLFDDQENDTGLYRLIHRTAKKYEGNALDPFVRRWSPSLLKLAMIMQLFIDSAANEISADALFAAFFILIPAIQSTMGLLAGELIEGPAQRRARTLMQWMLKRFEKTGKPIKRLEVLQSNKLDGKEYDEALNLLVERGDLISNGATKKTEVIFLLPDKV